MHTVAQWQAVFLALIAMLVIVVPPLTGLGIQVIQALAQLKSAWTQIDKNTARLDAHDKALNGQLDARIEDKVNNALSSNPGAASGGSGADGSHVPGQSG